MSVEFEAPTFPCPDFRRPFILEIDASDEGLGATLTQNTEEGEHVIAYASCSLNRNEKVYFTELKTNA